MSLLAVGSVALDAVETPFGKVDRAIGGSATFFACAARLLHPVQLVGVIGDDYPEEGLERLGRNGVDLAGLERRAGPSFFWAGRYSLDFQDRETLETRLGVFAEFEPKVPEAYRDAKYVFLGNIDPTLQLRVLDQMHGPTLVACDTMNFWIERTRDALMRVLERTDVLLLNDAEARQLSGEWNVYKSARWIAERGPGTVVVKQGEHGALLMEGGRVFAVPAFPLENVFDPTGAGDAFAGGFMGYLARTGDRSPAGLRHAMLYGAVMGSFAVERFSIERFEEISLADVEARVAEMRALVGIDVEER